MRLLFGDCEIDASRRELRRGGKPVALEPQVFDLLLYLIRHRDRVVSKDELIEGVWGGRIVSESTLTSRITAARQAIGDSGAAQALIRTLHRKGLRFVGEVAQETDAATLTHLYADASASRLPRIAGEGAERQRRDAGESSSTAFSLPDKPSIAVLPFANMSGDPEQEYFADGISEDIVTMLSRYPSLFVIARNSSFTYKGRAIEVTQIGTELGVRYVLEGSVRRAGDRVRITAQLIEAETGAHLWADRYDRNLADIFAVQDEITLAVTTAIAPAIAEAELHRAIRKPPDSIDAWTCYQRGLWHFENSTLADYRRAESFFQQAIDIDPHFADAYCSLAYAKLQAALIFQAGSLSDAMVAAEPLIRRAVSLDSSNAAARAWLSRALFLKGDLEGALAEVQRALALSPNFAFAYWQKGLILIFGGAPREGIADIHTSLRLEPSGSDFVQRIDHLAVGYYFDRQYEKAVEAARQSIRVIPDYPLPHRWLVVALGQLGRTEEARAALQCALALDPATFDLYVRQRMPWFRPEDHEHMLDGLRKAGWDG